MSTKNNSISPSKPAIKVVNGRTSSFPLKYTFPADDSVLLRRGSEDDSSALVKGDFTDDGGIDADFDFIEDDIAACMTEMQQKEPVLSHVRMAIEKGKRKIPEQLQDTTVSEV